jgi:hypothetical protein
MIDDIALIKTCQRGCQEVTMKKIQEDGTGGGFSKRSKLAV